MSDATEWKSTADRDADAIAVVTGALTDDEDLVAFTLEPLSRQQLVEICGVIAGWFSWAMREDRFDDPVEAVRRVALDLARQVEGLDDE